MARLSWEDIERGYKAPKPWLLVLQLLVTIGPLCFAPLLAVVALSVANNYGLSKLEALLAATAVFWLASVHLFINLPFPPRASKARAAKCPECKEPIFPLQAMLLKITGRCGHCGSKVEVTGNPSPYDASSETPDAQLISRERLQEQTLSRPVQAVAVCSLGAFSVSFLVLFFGAPIEPTILGWGFGIMVIGIIASLIMLHFHQRKCGEAPSCPHCKLTLRPWASTFVLMIGHCGRCHRKVSEPPPDNAMPAFLAKITRLELAQTGRRAKKLDGFIIRIGFFVVWLGFTVTGWVGAYWGGAYLYPCFQLMIFTLFVLLPVAHWLIDRRHRLEPHLRCPACSEPLLGKFRLSDAIVATDRCWHCSAKIFSDD